MRLPKIKVFEVDLKPLGFDSAVQAIQSKQIDGMILWNEYYG